MLGMLIRGRVVTAVLSVLLLGGFGFAGVASAASPLEADPASFDFGTLTIGQSYDHTYDYVTVENPSGDPVTIESVEITGADAAEFELNEITNCTAESTLPPDALCYVDLIFNPEATGVSSASVVLTLDAGDPLIIPLTGTGSELAGNAPEFATPTRTIPIDAEVESITAGDVDGDGLDDVLSTLFDDYNDLAVFSANEDTTLGSPDLYPVAGQFAGNVSTGHFNDDGDLDAVSSASGVARVFLNDGSGGMVDSADLATETWQAIQTVGDFNEDGFDDVVVSDEGPPPEDPDGWVGYLAFHPGDGEGGFGEEIRTRIGDQSLFGIVTADFDGDGKDDLAYTTYDRSRPVMMRSNGDGTFTRATINGGGGCGCQDPWGITASDLNGDGRDDITVALRFQNMIATYLSMPDGSFTRGQTLRVPLVDESWDTNPKGITSGDLNGDGIPDAVSADYLSGTASFFTGTGDGGYAFAGTRTLPDAGGPNAPAIGQFGAGVKADVSIGDQGSLSEGGSVFTLKNIGEPGQAPNPASLVFGETPSGYTSEPLTVELTNEEGIAPLMVSEAEFGGGSSSDFTVVDASDCTERVTLVGDSCSVEVAFKPVGPPGERDSQLSFRTNNEQNDLVFVPVSGTAGSDVPSGSVSPTSVSFGDVTVETAGPARSFALTNDGLVPLETGATTLEGAEAGDFTVGGACANKVLQPEESCTVTVGFTPSVLGARAATAKIAAEYGDFTVPLSGTGVKNLVPGVSAQPAEIRFESTEAGSVSATESITVNSTGTVPLDVTGVSLGGKEPGDFTIVSNGCAGAVQPGGSCSLTVAFAPTKAGTLTSLVTVASNAGDVYVTLGGTATSKPIPPVKPPKVTFKKKPKKKYVIKTKKLKKVKIAFKSNVSGSKFQCRIDKKKFTGCKSPKIYKNIKPGKHTIKVRAKKAGKTGPVKAVKFKVVRKR